MNRDDYWMGIACMSSVNCNYGQKVCILVDNNNNFLGIGIEGSPNNFLGTADIQIHAAINAVSNSKQTIHGTAYITYTPCLNCIQSLVAANIKNIIYIENKELESGSEKFNVCAKIEKFNGNLNWMRDYFSCIAF